MRAAAESADSDFTSRFSIGNGPAQRALIYACFANGPHHAAVTALLRRPRAGWADAPMRSGGVNAIHLAESTDQDREKSGTSVLGDRTSIVRPWAAFAAEG